MAESMQDIKRRMRSIESTEHITNAMRLVSAAKYRRAKGVFDKTNLHLGDVLDTMENMFSSAASLPERYVWKEEKEYNKTIYILITSERGLCGGFNNNLIKLLSASIKKQKKKTKNFAEGVSICAIGARGKEYFKRKGYPIISEYDGAPEKITFYEAREIAAPILEKYHSGEADQIVLVSTHYVNSLKQEPVIKRLLPMQKPEKGAVHDFSDIEFIPSDVEVIDYMIPKYFEIMLFKAVIESAACEHAARRTAMESATDNAKDMLNRLSLTYNRARQQAITDELIEIVAGSEAQR